MARWLLYITSVNRLMISKMKSLHGKSRSIICIANTELVFFCLSFFLQKNTIDIPCSVSIITWNLWTISFFALFCWFFVCSLRKLTSRVSNILRRRNSTKVQRNSGTTSVSTQKLNKLPESNNKRNRNQEKKLWKKNVNYIH